MAASEVVVAVFEREQLSSGLVAVHRAGFGPMARVLDPARGDLNDQLRRTGYQVPVHFSEGGAALALLLVTAPGRTERVAETLRRAGARDVYAATRAGQPVPLTEREPEPVVVDEQLPPPASVDR